jgi:hypothetical protein
VRLANAMALLPAAMFVDVQQRHTFQLQRQTLLLEDEYQVCFSITQALSDTGAPFVTQRVTCIAGGAG